MTHLHVCDDPLCVFDHPHPRIEGAKIVVA
jgi:hypothetical protein